MRVGCVGRYVSLSGQRGKREGARLVCASGGPGGLHGQCDGFQRCEIEFVRGAVDVEAHDASFGVKIGDKAVGDFARVDARTAGELDIELSVSA
jgi:hypothetical protein